MASDVAAFWRRVVAKRGLEQAVRVYEKNGETWVEINDELPYLPFLEKLGRPRFRVRMSGFLSRDHFGPSKDADGERTPRGVINRNENKDRGRVVFLIDVPAEGKGDEEELAGVLFHIDEKAASPVMFRAVALRTDSREKNDLSRAAATWLLGYLVEVSRQLRRPIEVGADEAKMGDPQLVASLGFRPRSAPKIALTGRYLAFRAPVSTRTPGTTGP